MLKPNPDKSLLEVDEDMMNVFMTLQVLLTQIILKFKI